jgi:hypothetical protein
MKCDVHIAHCWLHCCPCSIHSISSRGSIMSDRHWELFSSLLNADSNDVKSTALGRDKRPIHSASLAARSVVFMLGTLSLSGIICKVFVTVLILCALLTGLQASFITQKACKVNHTLHVHFISRSNASKRINGMCVTCKYGTGCLFIMSFSMAALLLRKPAWISQDT